MGVFSLVALTPAPVIAFVLFGIFGWLLVGRHNGSAVTLFIVVYCSNVMVAVAIYAIYLRNYGTPYYYGGSDDLLYEQFAQQVAQRLQIWQYSSIRSGIVEGPHNSVGYLYVVSLLYRMGELAGGFSTMIPRLLNAMALGLLSVLVYVVARSSHLPWQLSRNVALFVGLLPIMTFNAAHTFRDILVSLMTFWVCYHWHRAIAHGEPRLIAWAWTLLVTAAMCELRQTQAVAVLLIGTVSDILLVDRRRSLGKLGSIVHGTTVSVLVCLGVWLLGLDWMLRRVSFYTEHYTGYRADLAIGLSSAIFSAPLPLSLALRSVYGLVVPIPFLGRRFEELFQGMGTLLHLYFLPYLGLAVSHLVRRRTGRLWVICLGLFYGMYLLTFTSRHIVVVLPYAALVAAHGYLFYRRYRVQVGFAVVGIGVFSAVLYSSLKLLGVP